MPDSPTLLDHVEHQHNRLADAKAIWWPFVFLRPEEKAEPIRLRRKLLMVLCFSAWFELAWAVKRLIFGTPLPQTFGGWAMVYVWFLIGFFVWLSLVTIFFWNRRAAREGREPEGTGSK